MKRDLLENMHSLNSSQKPAFREHILFHGHPQSKHLEMLCRQLICLILYQVMFWISVFENKFCNTIFMITALLIPAGICTLFLVISLALSDSTKFTICYIPSTESQVEVVPIFAFIIEIMAYRSKSVLHLISNSVTSTESLS